MAKTTKTYWNPLREENKSSWNPIEGMEEVAGGIDSAMDEETGDYTRLTRFKPGADTSAFGAKSHDYPEEIMILGRPFV